jgi:hypothetical protein
MGLTVKIFLFLALIFCFSCEDQGLIVKCPDCVENEPKNTDLDIKLDSSPGYVTLVNVYEGNIEDSVIYTSMRTTLASALIKVTLNKKYSVTASYYENGKYYVAVNSATPRVRFEKSQCDNPCYFVYDRNINLRMKYTK